MHALGPLYLRLRIFAMRLAALKLIVALSFLLRIFSIYISIISYLNLCDHMNTNTECLILETRSYLKTTHQKVLIFKEIIFTGSYCQFKHGWFSTLKPLFKWANGCFIYRRLIYVFHPRKYYKTRPAFSPCSNTFMNHRSFIVEFMIVFGNFY